MTKAKGTTAFTLIEVLLAITLLVLLAGVSVGILRDAGEANIAPQSANQIDGAARLIDAAIAKHTTELYNHSLNESWSPQRESLQDQHTVQVRRVQCDDCPEGWGRFRIEFDAVVLTRFHRVQPDDEAVQ